MTVTVDVQAENVSDHCETEKVHLADTRTWKLKLSVIRVAMGVQEVM